MSQSLILEVGMSYKNMYNEVMTVLQKHPTKEYYWVEGTSDRGILPGQSLAYWVDDEGNYNMSNAWLPDFRDLVEEV